MQLSTHMAAPQGNIFPLAVLHRIRYVSTAIHTSVAFCRRAVRLALQDHVSI